MARTAKTAAVPKVLLQQHSFGQQLPTVPRKAMVCKAQPRAAATPRSFAVTYSSGRCLVL